MVVSYIGSIRVRTGGRVKRPVGASYKSIRLTPVYDCLTFRPQSFPIQHTKRVFSSHIIGDLFLLSSFYSNHFEDCLDVMLFHFLGTRKNFQQKN